MFLKPKRNKEISLLIPIRNLCSNKCIFCARGNRKECIESDYKEIIKSLSEYNLEDFTRAQIGGDEPLNFHSIKKLIRYLKIKDFKKICIKTVGRKISDIKLLKELIELGVSDFELPLYGSTDIIHDSITRVKGSFNEVVKGIQNLIKLNIYFKLHTIILKQNLENLYDLIDFAQKEFNKNIKLILLFPDSKNAREYQECAPRLSNIPQKLLKKTELYLPCINYHLDRSFTDLYKAYNKRVGQAPLRDQQNMHKLDTCKKCIYFEMCDGYYLQYFKLYGTEEFKPIQKKVSILRRLFK
ncbi:MAG: radical SAM protein [Spirochaetes bacterium]|nr:radical SAM protein [Spirochaetota bacterium]